MSGAQRFYCNYDGCDKSFRRREHLNRHALNHTNQTILCPRCQKVFYRNDLLQRHLVLRHGLRKNSPYSRPASDKSPGQSDAGSASTAENISSERQELASGAIDLQEMSNGMEDQILPTLQQQQQNITLVPDQRQGPRHSGNNSYQTPPSYESGAVLAAPSDDHTAGLSLGTEGFDIDNFSNQSSNPAARMDWLFDMQSEYPPGTVSVQPNSHAGQTLQSGFLSIGPSAANTATQLGFEMYTALISFFPTQTESTSLIASPDMATRYIENAIAHLDVFAPFFHKHTRNVNFLPTELCASLLAIGLLISHYKGAHELGCTLLSHLRELVLPLINRPIGNPQMWILETMFLVEYAGMFFGDRASVEASDIMHGNVVAIARRLRIAQAVKLPSTLSPDSSLQQSWYDWAKTESLNRLAYCIFISDVQHAVFFGHVRAMSSPVSLNLKLPCDDALWNAASAEEWEIRSKEVPQSPLIKFSEIYCSLTLNETQSLDRLSSNAFSTLIMLAAFSSLAVYAKQQSKDPFYNASHAENCVRFAQNNLYNIVSHQPRCALRDSSLMFYHLTAISLNTPLSHLETATNVGYSRAGTTPAEETRLATMRLLTREKVTTEAAKHAVEMLRIYIGQQHQQRLSPSNKNSRNFDAVVESSPFEITALYFGVLTLWAYLFSQGFDSETSTYSYPQLKQRGMVAILDDLLAAIDSKDVHGCVKNWREMVPPVTLRLTERKCANAREYAAVLTSLADALV